MDCPDVHANIGPARPEPSPGPAAALESADALRLAALRRRSRVFAVFVGRTSRAAARPTMPLSARHPPAGRISRAAAHPTSPGWRSREIPSGESRQRGAVLAVSLIFLLLLSIVAISLMRSGQLEVLMAGNTQAQLDAFQLAEGIAESALARWEDNLNPKDIVCSDGHPNPDGDCNRFDLAWDPRLDPDSTAPAPLPLPAIKGATVTGRARPLNDGEAGCVPAFITGIAHGTWAFFFDVEATFDNTEVRQGASQVNYGAVLVNPVSADCFSKPPDGNLDKFAHLRSG